MNPAFAFVILVVVASTAQAQHNPTVSHKKIAGNWKLAECSGSEYLDSTKEPANSYKFVLFPVNDKVFGDFDLVIWREKTKDGGLTDGAFTASKTRGYDSWVKVINEATEEPNKTLQKVWLDIYQGIKSIDFKTEDEFTISSAYNKKGRAPKCTFKREK